MNYQLISFIGHNNFILIKPPKHNYVPRFADQIKLLIFLYDNVKLYIYSTKIETQNLVPSNKWPITHTTLYARIMALFTGAVRRKYSYSTM